MRCTTLLLCASCAIPVAEPEQTASVALPLTVEQHGTVGGTNAVELASPVSGYSPWRWTTSENQPERDPLGNRVMALGINVTPTSGPAGGGRHSMWMGLEDDYLTAGDTRQTEWYLQYYGDDATSRRPLALAVDLDSHQTSVNLKGRTSFFSSTGIQLLMIEENGLVQLMPTSGSSMIVKRGNHTPILAGAMVNDAAEELIRIDDTDRMVLDRPGRLVSVQIKNDLEVTGACGCWGAAPPATQPDDPGEVVLGGNLHDNQEALAAAINALSAALSETRGGVGITK